MKRTLLLTSLIYALGAFSTFEPAQLQGQEDTGTINKSPETEAASKDGKSEDDKPAIESVTAEFKPISVYESFTGTFEPTRVNEVRTDFEKWTDLKIESRVDEGEVVSVGQELLKFATESIEKAVAEAEFEAMNARFDVETARLEMKEVNQTFELDQAVAERSWKNSQEDYAYYQNTRLPEQLKDLDYSEKTAGYYLEYAKDELDQLEQMYNEDELTEESEEIVLKRARRDVESSERARDRSLLQTKRQREMEIPREKLQQKETLQRAETAFQRSMITLPIKKQKTEIALAQAEFNAANKQKHLQELQADQKKMILTAPANGLLYYGRCLRGKWVGPSGSSSRRLEPYQKIPQHAVVMTIVDIDQMMIRANLEEKELESLAPRMRGKALIPAAGNKTVPVMIKAISRIPLDDGKFDCQLTVEDLPVDGSVMPGMTCKLSFLVYENKQALVVPKDSVFTDDDGVSHYVYVLEGEVPKRREVSVGHTIGSDTEILSGLTAGDKIAKSRP